VQALRYIRNRTRDVRKLTNVLKDVIEGWLRENRRSPHALRTSACLARKKVGGDEMTTYEAS